MLQHGWAEIRHFMSGMTASVSGSYSPGMAINLDVPFFLSRGAIPHQVGAPDVGSVVGSSHNVRGGGGLPIHP